MRRETQRSAHFLLLYALANAGGVLAFLPLLSLLLPLRIEALAGDERIAILSAATIAGAVAASVSNIVAGMASDRSFAARGSRRRWIVGGLIATILSYAGIAAAPSAAATVIAVVAYQLALNVMLAPLMAMMADEVPDAQKGVAGGLLALASPLASFAGAVIVGTAFAEPARFGIVCALVAILVVPVLLLPPRRADAAAPPPEVRALRRVDLALIWASRLMLQISCVVLLTYLLFFFQTITTESAAALAPRIGTVSAIVYALAVPVAILAGRWSDRVGKRKPFLAGAAVLTAAGLLAMAAARDWTWAVVGYAAFACGSQLFLGLHSAFAMQVLPSPQHRGRDLGLLNLANTLPALLGPALTWWLATTERFTDVLLTLAALTLVAGALTLMVRSER